MKKIGYENLGPLITWNCGTGKLFPSIAQYIFRGQKKKISYTRRTGNMFMGAESVERT